MTLVLPDQVLDCPDPASCPVPETLDDCQLVEVAAGRYLYRIYNGAWGYDEFNPGFGDARFSPFDALDGTGRVPAMYLATTEVAAMLETVFHEVHEGSSRSIYIKDLREQLLAHVRMPSPAMLLDLRDEALQRLGVSRPQVTTSSAEHYPCTRRLGQSLLASRSDEAQGIIWHSRQAELAGLPPAEVMVLFGGGRYEHGRGTWQRVGPGSRNLFEGPGRLLVDQVAELLSAVVEPDSR